MIHLESKYYYIIASLLLLVITINIWYVRYLIRKLKGVTHRLRTTDLGVLIFEAFCLKVLYWKKAPAFVRHQVSGEITMFVRELLKSVAMWHGPAFLQKQDFSWPRGGPLGSLCFVSLVMHFLEETFSG